MHALAFRRPALNALLDSRELAAAGAPVCLSAINSIAGRPIPSNQSSGFHSNFKVVNQTLPVPRYGGPTNATVSRTAFASATMASWLASGAVWMVYAFEIDA